MNLNKHFKRGHFNYDDTGRIVSEDEYRRIVHNEDHNNPNYEGHRVPHKHLPKWLGGFAYRARPLARPKGIKV